MKIVLDTSVIIDYLRTKDPNSLYRRLGRKYGFIVSLVTVSEVYSGKSIQKNRPAEKTLEDILGGIEIIIPDIDTAKEAGRLRAKYRLSIPDAFIAALAKGRNLPLATLNIKDMGKIKELKILGD